MIEHLNKLSSKELLRFEKFIESPYFNTVEKVKKLFYYLKPIYPDITKEHLDNENLYRQVYPGIKYDDAKIRKLRSNFRKMLEEFLIQNELESEIPDRRVILLKAFRKKDMKGEFDLVLADIKKSLKNQTLVSKNDTFYINHIELLNEERYRYYGERKHDIAPLLQEKSDHIDFLFAFLKLHTFHEMLVYNYEKGETGDFKKGFSDDVMAFVEKNIDEISLNHPNLYIIYLVNMMYTEKDSHYVEVFKDYMKNNEHRFFKYQLGYYYRYLESFYWSKINEGQVNYRKEVFNIYKQMVSKNVFVLDDYLMDIEFNNVVNISLPLGEYSWTEEFIENHKGFLVSDLSNETYNLAKAKLYFYKKEFGLVVDCLNNILFKDSYYYINSKFLLARTLFEQRNYESVPFVLANLNQYTKRGKFYLNLQQKKVVINFIKYFNLLLKYIESNDRNKLFVLKKELLNEKKFVSGKDWFISKIDNFTKS